MKWVATITSFIQIFILSSHSQDIEHWESLKSNVINIDLIVDKLVFKDIQLTATNDDQYFVFEDILYQVNARVKIRTLTIIV